MFDIFKAFMGGQWQPKEDNQPQPEEKQVKKERRPRGTPVTRVLISLAVTLVFGFIYFYFKLPALNIHTSELYWFVFWLCVVFCVCMILLRGFRAEKPTGYISYSRKKLAIPFYVAAVVVLALVMGWLSGVQLFRARDYAQLIQLEDGDFAAEVAEISFDQIPLLDEDSANRLADRKLGELSDLVSQFTVNDASAQINYNDHPVRVSYLDYGGLFKWLNNRGQGIPAYMIVDMVSQEVTVQRLEEGIKYSPSEYFGRDLQRHLRFNYPTKMFGDVNFEIDEEGTPYWVASVLDKTIGLFDGDDIVGAVLMNAVTGETTYYSVAEVPTWVDRVFSASLLLEQYNYHGKYQNGFFNAIFGQRGCTTATSGYNYIAQDDDVWLYTGITSISEDRGNIGFILVNQRTKEARYYPCAGAEEFSAESSAEGAVQQYSYNATFPLLLNISDQPTYFMALKDAAGLVKMYAMVNVQQYNIVATGNTVAECQKNYSQMLLTGNIVEEEEVLTPDESVVEGKIAEIRSANMDGDSYYFFRLERRNDYYTISAKDFPLAVILNVGDTVKITYTPGEGPILSGTYLALA